MSFVMDFSAPVPVSDGLHTATVKEAKPGTSAKNNPTITVRWHIDTSDDPANVGKALFDTLTFTPNAMWKITALLSAAGIDTSSWSGKPFTPAALQEIAEALLGETLVVRTKVQVSTQLNPATGEPYPSRANVTGYQPYGSVPTASDMFAGDDEDLDATFK